MNSQSSLSGQRAEGLGAELPGKDEDQEAARRPAKDEQAEDSLEPPREWPERVTRDCRRADPDHRGVAAPVLVHGEIEAGVSDQEQRGRYPENPADRQGRSLVRVGIGRVENQSDSDRPGPSKTRKARGTP